MTANRSDLCTDSWSKCFGVRPEKCFGSDMSRTIIVLPVSDISLSGIASKRPNIPPAEASSSSASNISGDPGGGVDGSDCVNGGLLGGFSVAFCVAPARTKRHALVLLLFWQVKRCPATGRGRPVLFERRWFERPVRGIRSIHIKTESMSIRSSWSGWWGGGYLSRRTGSVSSIHSLIRLRNPGC
ncbi:unnamed protein product [Somion occarium]|uniref:Uncharacterized protein n=1 Tax=Somion occarium TaxID=3059160 RepID=A0ABP1CN96_9APHY